MDRVLASEARGVGSSPTGGILKVTYFAKSSVRGEYFGKLSTGSVEPCALIRLLVQVRGQLYYDTSEASDAPTPKTS